MLIAIVAALLATIQANGVINALTMLSDIRIYHGITHPARSSFDRFTVCWVLPLAWLDVCIPGAGIDTILKHAFTIFSKRDMLLRVVRFGLLQFAMTISYSIFFGVGSGLALLVQIPTVLYFVFGLGTFLYLPFHHALSVVCNIDLMERAGPLEDRKARAAVFSRLQPSASAVDA